MTLSELQRIKQWHVAHRADHPLEYQIWDAVLTVWLMGWMGIPSILLFDWVWALPLCLVAMFAPQLYVRWRRHAARTARLRCDWLQR